MNNKIQYEEPKMEIVVFKKEDIITSSNKQSQNPIEMEEIYDW